MRFILCIFIFLFAFQLKGQIEISGIVRDSLTKDYLPFASVSLKHKMAGTTTNEFGQFKVIIPESAKNDTLKFSFMGYKSLEIPISSSASFVEIALASFTIQMNEVVISPKTPEFYIKQFQINRDSNYVNTPFGNTAYYREQITENDAHISHSEAIFKSYYPDYRGNKKNQHQVVLYRERDDIQEIAFMKEKREKFERKEIKRAKKEGREISAEEVEVLEALNGPEQILNLDFIKRPHLFLDSANFKKYEYTLEPRTYFDGHEIIVISFKAKRNIENMRSEGKIYLDSDSYAIASLEYYGYVIIPAYVKPILFAMGLGVGKPRYDVRLNYREANEQWYPDQIYMNVNVNLTHKRLWKKNTKSKFDMEAFYGVNQLQLENLSPIPKEKRFDNEIDMKDQVHPEANISWKGVNVVTRRQ